MKKKLKRWSLINLIIGYILSFCFVLLVLLNRAPDAELLEVIVEEDLFTGVHNTDVVYIGKTDYSIRPDRSGRVILDDIPDVVVTHGIADTRDYINYGENLIGGEINHEIRILDDAVDIIPDGSNDGYVHRGNHRTDVVHNEPIRDSGGVVDPPLLERRLKELKEKGSPELGVDKEETLSLTLDKDLNGDFGAEIPGTEKGAGGSNKGQLYAYDFPSRGVGAGIGSPAIGAGIGSAGLGAGIGEAILDGKPIPTLGGVGTYYSNNGSKGPALAPPSMGGVGGLVGGAGAGGAAGLTAGMARQNLGLGIPQGVGIGGGSGVGHGTYNFKHLPPDGGLHIMMHVDGSGSILNTRKQLDIMRHTLLKEALLPYYNNDESLYNRRVTIVDGNGERTLQFFKDASKKDHVLAFVFQDEAQPAYHMPNFNRQPEDRYLDDLNSLKSSLGAHTGLYRGIMLQVDRGRTFAKSFKEFVENSWQGKGYLEEGSANLKKYYWENNKHHINNKDGIVFSDVYHVKDEGEPQYYLDLIFKSAKRVGIDLTSQE